MIKVRHMAQICREAMSANSGTPHWDDLNDRQRRMSMFVVNYILANPETIPIAVHNAWMGEMIHNEGFSVGLYDEAARTHPDLRPYADLAPHVQDAYAISIGIVRGLTDVQDHYELCTPPARVEKVQEEHVPSSTSVEPTEITPAVEADLGPVIETAPESGDESPTTVPGTAE